MNITEMARDLQLAKADAKAADQSAKEAKQFADDMERRFFATLEQMGVGSIKVDGTLFVPTATVYATVQDADAFKEWVDEQGLSDLYEPKPRKQLLNELVHDCLDSGQPLPPGLGFYSKEYVSQRVG